MHVEKITYTDYAGKERTEDFNFSLNKAEIIKWLAQSGGFTLDQVLEKLIHSENSREIINIFDDLLHRAYGEVSLDGKKFIKAYTDPEVASNFFDTEAYSVLFMKLIGDAEFAGNFLNSIIPKDLAEDVAKILAENPDGIPDEVKDYIPKRSGNVAQITPVN